MAVSSSCATCSHSIVDDPMPTLVRNFHFSQAEKWDDDDYPSPGESDTPIGVPVVVVTTDLCTSCQLDKASYGKYGTPYHQDGIFEAVSAIAVAAAGALDLDELVSADAPPSLLLTQAFIEDVFVGLVRRGLFASDPTWRDDDPLTFHVDPMSDPSGWDAIRTELARALWILLQRERRRRQRECGGGGVRVLLSIPDIVARLEREFGKRRGSGTRDDGSGGRSGGIAADVLQLVAREALDEYVLSGRLGEARDPQCWDLDCGFRSVEADADAPDTLRRPVLRHSSARDLRAARKKIVAVDQFLAFLDRLDDRLEAQGMSGW